MTDDRKKRILLIDDDTSLLVTLGDFLAFEDYEVTTAESGEEGLKRLERMEPDLIILDMSMPGMGGVGFLRRISSEDGKPKYPVLVLTARANMAEFFADVDVDGFVAKPCEPQDLLAEVARIIFLRSGSLSEGNETGADSEKTGKVLIGEDDAGVSKRLSAALQAAGYAVETADKGPDVLEKALVSRPDVILVKLVFAGMNGDVVGSMLRELPNARGIPVVLYDDSGSGEPESRYLKSGIKKFVRSNETGSLLSAVREVAG
ncbi:MAG: response regulator [Kiritimatiellia bacterium]